MADKKKAAKPAKSLGKKDMKKTKGGTLNFLPAVQHDISINVGTNMQKWSPGQISSADGSV